MGTKAKTGLGGAKAGAQTTPRKKRDQENRTDSRPRSRRAGPTQVCHLTPLPGTATLPSQSPEVAAGQGGTGPGGAPWPHRIGWRTGTALAHLSSPFLSGRFGENSQHHSRRLHASSSPAQAPPPPEPPLRSRLTPTPFPLPKAAAVLPAPRTPASGRTHLRARPLHLATGGRDREKWRQQLAGQPPRATFTPTSCLRPRLRRGPRRALCCQWPAGEPIPALP